MATRGKAGAAPQKAWDLLGLTRGAPEAEVKRAYRSLCRLCHPDQPGGSAEAFQALQCAYQEVLAEIRGEVDSQREKKGDRGAGSADPGPGPAKPGPAPFARQVAEEMAAAAFERGAERVIEQISGFVYRLRARRAAAKGGGS